MRDRYSEFEERSAQLLAIAPDTLENARSYFQLNDIPFPCLPDPERAVFRMYDVKSAMISLGQRPGLFVIDKEGTVRYAYLGWQQWEIPTVDETRAWVDSLSLRYPIFMFDGDDLIVHNTFLEHWSNEESYQIDYPDVWMDSDGRLLKKSDAGNVRVRISDSGAEPDPERLRQLLLHALEKRGANPSSDATLESLIALAQATER